MLLIALTFAYIVFTTVNFGACMNSMFRLKTADIVTVSLLGLFGVTIFASTWALFSRINWEFHIAMGVANILLFFLFRNAVVANYRLLRIRFRKLPKKLKLLLIASSLLIVAKSAAAPFIPDNESYYIQTVKWLNEYGFVNGLANLHLFLAQMSGWHIAQSAFSFSFLYPNFNDLSGYCLILANLYAVFRLHDFFQTRSTIALVMGLFPIANVFLLQFSGAPSPDVPIVLLTFVAVDVFFCHFEAPGRATFTLLAILVLFALYIKITAAAIAILPLLALASNFRKVISGRLVLLALGILCLFVIKNLMVSGLALFPLPTDFGFACDWRIPEHVSDYLFSESRPFPYGLTKAQFDAMSALDILLNWLRMPNLHGIFNTTAVLLVLISPVLIYKNCKTKPMWIVYVTMCAQLCLLLWLSPQYRFFMNFMLFFGFFAATCVPAREKWIIPMLSASLAIAAIAVFVPMKLDRVTGNALAHTTTVFSWEQLIFPHPNSKFGTGFKMVKNGNLKYYSPAGLDFFWGTSNGPLPCVNEHQIEFFEKRFGIRPQLRGKEVSDGFVSDTVR